MSKFYRLLNKVKHYDWGSTVDIPRLLGIAADGAPWAELWIGSHSGSPSTAILGSDEITLGDLIARDPRLFLGEETARRYGALPFLLKLLAAEKPLSIQAHPNLAQAREGFERENRVGLTLDSPERNYKDANHKPEIIAALTPFKGLCGFRGVDEIRALLTVFLKAAPSVLRDGFAPLTRALSSHEPLRDFLTGLFGLSQQAREVLGEYVLSLKEPLAGIDLKLIQKLARLYPGDPAIIAPIYLNVFRLEPGEAVFLEAGVLHAYIHGFGVELMANSDNVLRGGLTKKNVDVPELIKILDFKPFKPKKITPNADCFSYPTPCEEFSLTRIRGSGGASCGGVESWPIAPNSPALCIVTEGEVIIDSRNSDRETVVKQGESLFIPPVKESSFSLKGKFTMFIASCGLQAMSNEQ
jgi:mannose-6-phosphate isomerase